MPYIILTANGEEIQRAELTGPLVIGRSVECHVPVRDVLMSRRHGRLDWGTGRDRGRWTYRDLGSRNGSHINGNKVAQHTLVDGDTLRIGRTRLTFIAGPFVPAPAEVKRRAGRLVRPADPHEALSGTVADFTFVDREDNAEFDAAPSPPGRHVGSGKTIYSPLEELSSSWDSIVATASRQRVKARPMPRAHSDSRPELYPKPHLTPPRRREADMSLQAHPMQVPYLEVVSPPSRRRMNIVPVLILTAGISAATLLVLVSGWMMTKG